MKLNTASNICKPREKKQNMQTLCFGFWSFLGFGGCLLSTWEVLLKSFWYLRLKYLPLIIQRC